MPKWLTLLLLPFSWLYGFVVLLRTYLYKSGIFTRSKFDFPIICVGNITAGGTGKTPHIEFMIRLLEKDYKIAVLSRGYKRKTSGYLFATMQSTTHDIGDEPYLIRQKNPDIALAVGENRVLSIPSLLGDAPETQLVLMDDGFQHLSIQAGFNIVLCDYNRPYYDDYLLPAGLLREPGKAAARADIIIVSKCPSSLSIQEQKAIILRLKPLGHQHVFFSSVVYKEFQPLTQAAKESAFLPHQNNTPNYNHAIALAGIGNAEPFISEVSKYFETTEKLIYSDHANYDGEKINMIRHKADQPNTIVITTEKDAVKLMDEHVIQHINQIPVWYLPIGISILNNETETLKSLLTNYIEKEISAAQTE